MTGRPIQIRPAPRRVSLGLELQLLFGGSRTQFGWFFFAFGLLFFVVFVGQSELLTAASFWRTRAATTGRIYSVEVTSNAEDDRPIYSIHYAFEVDGEKFEGRSFTLETGVEPGQSATIDYVVDNPNVSRIEGMRAAPFSSWVILVALLPLAGLALIIDGLLRGARAIALMKRGEISYGKLVSTTLISSDEGRSTFDLVFAFEAASRSWTVKVRTDHPEPLQDEREEPLLYNPRRPSEAVMIDSLPGAPRVTRSGDVEAYGTPLLVLLLPTIMLTGCGYVLSLLL